MYMKINVCVYICVYVFDPALRAGGGTMRDAAALSTPPGSSGRGGVWCRV